MVPGDYVHDSMERFYISAVSGESYTRFPNDVVQFKMASRGLEAILSRELSWNSPSAQKTEDQDKHREHQKDRNECVFPLSFRAFELIFTAGAAEFFVHRDGAGAHDTMAVFGNRGFLLLGSEIFGHSSRA